MSLRGERAGRFAPEPVRAAELRRQLSPAADITPKMLTAGLCHKPTYAVQQKASLLHQLVGAQEK
jgi:hypothetical protein